MIVGQEKTLASIKAWMNPGSGESPPGLLVLTPSAMTFWETRFGVWVRGDQLWFASFGAIARVYSWRAGLFFKNRITVQVRRNKVDYTVDSIIFRVEAFNGVDLFIDDVRKHITVGQ